PAQMVLQLCGRVCRRLSFKNPHHLLDEDFLFYANTQKVCSIAGAPTAIGGRRLSFENPHQVNDGDFLVYSGFGNLGCEIQIVSRQSKIRT
ncbi:hypothetical protein, partial [Flavobacterium plurextorum]